MLNISKPAAYGVLAISIVFEIIGSSCLEACHGFQDKKLTIILIICYLIAFGLFSKILHIINLAVGYSTWTAVGAIACAIIGIIFFDQHLTPIGWAAMIAMIIGVFLLNLYGTPAESSSEDADPADKAVADGTTSHTLKLADAKEA